MMRVARKKRLPRPPRRYAQQVKNDECTLFNCCSNWIFNNHCHLIFLLFSTLFLLSSHTEAAACYKYSAPNAFQNGNNLIYYCNSGWEHVMPQNECRATTACPDLPPEEQPNCVEGWEPYVNESFGGGFACFQKCPPGEERVFIDGLPQNQCQPPPCKDWEERDSNNQCVPLECRNPSYELVLLPFAPYRSCAYKCEIGYERDFDKYGDFQCHEKPVQCQPDEILVNGQCVKKEKPACDPEWEFYFLCQWYEDFKSFTSSVADLFSQLMNQQDQIHRENKEFQSKVLQELAASSPVGNGNSDPTVAFNQEKQLAQDKQFYDDSRDFFAWAKEQKEEEQNPDPDKDKPIVEDKDYQVDEQQRVNWSASCPISGSQASVSLMGETATTLGFDYSELCSMAQKMRPLILLAGAFISMLIIAGGLRK